MGNANLLFSFSLSCLHSIGGRDSTISIIFLENDPFSIKSLVRNQNSFFAFIFQFVVYVPRI